MTATPLSRAYSLPHRCSVTDDDNWRRDRLAEARRVLADVTHHPDRLIILAARVVSLHADDPVETAEANDLRQLLEPRPFQMVSAAAQPQGGAA